MNNDNLDQLIENMYNLSLRELLLEQDEGGDDAKKIAALRKPVEDALAGLHGLVVNTIGKRIQNFDDSEFKQLMVTQLEWFAEQIETVKGDLDNLESSTSKALAKVGLGDAAKQYGGLTEQVKELMTGVHNLGHVSKAAVSVLAQYVLDGMYHENANLKDVPMADVIEQDAELDASKISKEMAKAMKSEVVQPKKKGGLLAMVKGFLGMGGTDISVGPLGDESVAMEDLVEVALQMTPFQVGRGAEALMDMVQAQESDESEIADAEGDVEEVIADVVEEEEAEGGEEGDENAEGVKITPDDVKDQLGSMQATLKLFDNFGYDGDGFDLNVETVDGVETVDLREFLTNPEVTAATLSKMKLESVEEGIELLKKLDASYLKELANWITEMQESGKEDEEIVDELENADEDQLDADISADGEVEAPEPEELDAALEGGEGEEVADGEEAAEQAEEELESAAQEAAQSEDPPAVAIAKALDAWAQGLSPTSQKSLEQKGRLDGLKGLVDTSLENAAAAVQGEVEKAVQQWRAEHEETLIKSKRFAKKNFDSLQELIPQIAAALLKKTNESGNRLTKSAIRKSVCRYLDKRFRSDSLLSESKRWQVLAGIN